MFPVGVLISMIAMAAGIGGAVFFSPFFFLVLHLEPQVAFATGLLTFSREVPFRKVGMLNRRSNMHIKSSILCGMKGVQSTYNLILQKINILLKNIVY